MHRDGEIAPGIARDVTMSYRLTPSVEIPPQRRKTIERRDRKPKRQLADEDHQKPKPGCRFQHVSAKEFISKRLVMTAVLMFASPTRVLKSKCGRIRSVHESVLNRSL